MQSLYVSQAGIKVRVTENNRTFSSLRFRQTRPASDHKVFTMLLSMLEFELIEDASKEALLAVIPQIAHNNY